MSDQCESKKPFTVALVVNSSVNGGAEKYLYDLYRELTGRNICKVILVGSLPGWPLELGESYATGPPRKFTRRSNVIVQIIQSLYYPFRIRKIIGKLKPDLIHMQFMREKLLLPSLLTKYCKVLWTEHGTIPEDFSGIPLRIYKWQSKHATIVSISEVVKESLIQHGIESLLIPNPIPSASPNLAVINKSNELVIKDRFKVVYVGRIHENKRIELLMEVAKLLPEVEFIIAGEGAHQKLLLEQSSPNVSFLGFVRDVESLMLSADTLLITSGRAAREGSPLAMLEARSLGIPVLVASDCHAATEAKSLGCSVFDPDARALRNELQAIIEGNRYRPLDEEIRAERSFESWSKQHSLLMLGMRIK
jgi:glycosyltransferase involved in cell wall biosynthesis